MLLKKKNKEIIYTFPFCFLLIEYIFGMYLNDMLPSVFKYLDELLSVVLLFWSVGLTLRRRETFNKEIRVFFLVVAFYLGYSLFIKSNVPNAIFGDMLIQLKPFIAFYMFSYIGFILSNTQKKIIKKVSVWLFVITVILTLFSSMIYGMFGGITFIFGHVSSYGTSLILIALTYLYCSDIENKKDLIIFFLILTLSLFSTRAKIYGIYVIIVFLVFVMRGNIDMKISMKNILTVFLGLSIILYITWSKVQFYFIDFLDIDSDYALARPALYITGWNILFDYFPFGSGFASFATHYSGVYYSNIYSEYGLNTIWGLLEEDPGFIADTGYPPLAQFGLVGVFLFFLFFKRIVSNANKYKRETNDTSNYLIIVLLLVTLAIQCVADAAFTSNKGFYIMILLGLVLTESHSRFHTKLLLLEGREKNI